MNLVAADVSPLYLKTGDKSEPTHVICYGLVSIISPNCIFQTDH